MPRTRITAMIVACSLLALAATGCGDDGGGGGEEPTPGVTTVGLQTQVSALVTPFPTPIIDGSNVDSSASKGYSATFPEGWNFYPNRIQTRDASADVAFEPLTVGATAQASIVVNCIASKSASPEEHIRFEATKVAQIGTNTGHQVAQRQISGVDATVVSYRFESTNDENIPALEKQDILFSNGACDWIITTTTPEGRRAEFEPQFKRLPRVIQARRLTASAHPYVYNGDRRRTLSRIAYLDCFSGISGDMLLGALIDVGLDAVVLGDELHKLGVEGWRLRSERVSRAGIAATLARVELAEAPQPHRRLPDILGTIERSSLPTPDRECAARIFRRLAEAEARVHGTAPDEIDFHEVGALDAIVDVCGAVVGLRMLGVDRLHCSALPAGGGTARSQHGELPVPAPATLELIALAGAPVAAANADRPMEMVTPTGAAIVTTLAEFSRPAMTVERVGYGAGGRNPDGWPNALRLWLGEAADAPPTMLLVETNIDDMNPELYGYVQEKLFAAGAADVWFQPVQMKKNRPGVMISVLCAPEREDAIASVLLRETSTLGLRVSPVTRHEAAREVLEFESSLGPAAVKVKRLPGEPARIAPEYEACRRIAEERGLPLAEVYRVVEREALERIN